MDLKNDINNKEKQLHKSKMEIQELTVKINLLKKKQQSEKNIKEKNTAKRNMSSAVCASSIYKSLALTPLYMQSFALVVFA